MERNLFGSISFRALKRKTNIEEVFTYPLTLIPLRLCHIDGKMSKTTKSTLMKELEKSRVLNHPEMVDVVTADEMFFLHLLSNLPETSELSRSILRNSVLLFLPKGLTMYLIR